MPYTPSKGEYVFTGVFGVCLYAFIGMQAVWLLRRGIKLQTSKLFFFALISMCLLEQPRYLELAVRGVYDSRVCYCFHILAGIAFFAAFSIVAHQWSGLLALSTSFKVIYGFQGLVAVNVIFGVFDVLSIGLCLAAPTLQDYFLSPAFEIITLVEAIRNVAYCGMLAYFGVFLVCRFVHFSSIDALHAPDVSNPISSAGPSAGQLSSPLSDQLGKGQSQSLSQCPSQSQAPPVLAPSALEEPTSLAFRKAAVRLSAVLVVATICYLMRAIMLIVKVAIIQNEKQGGAEGGSTFFEYSSPSFPLFGFLWFVCTDFLPRGVPSIVFMALMAKGRNKRSSATTLVPTHLPGKASSFSLAPSVSVGSSFKPSFSASHRGFFAGYGRGDDGMSGDEGGYGPYEDEEEGEDFQFVRLAGDEQAREGGVGTGRDGAEMQHSVSAELRGEVHYLSDDDSEEPYDGGLDEVLIQAAFASSGGSSKRVVNL